MNDTTFLNSLINAFLNYLIETQTVSLTQLNVCLKQSIEQKSSLLEIFLKQQVFTEETLTQKINEFNLLQPSQIQVNVQTQQTPFLVKSFSQATTEEPTTKETKVLFKEITDWAKEKNKTTNAGETLFDERLSDKSTTLNKTKLKPTLEQPFIDSSLSTESLEEDEATKPFENEDATRYSERNIPSTSSVLPDVPVAPTTAVVEEKVNERYKILEALGEGGMGVVQLVWDNLLQREVALKKIKVQLQNLHKLSEKQQVMLARLNREASITAFLEHPNIVPLYDMEKKESGELFFTMRKIEGDTLREIIQKQQENTLKQEDNSLLPIFLKVCDAMAYAHSKMVIHRDLKPDNIMVGQFGEVYVMDWGIAKNLKEEESSLPLTLAKNETSNTDLQTVGGIGTPGYMPPEQRQNAAAVGPTADIFALGAILRECFTFSSPNQEFRDVLKLYEKYRLQGIQKAGGEIEKEIDAKIPPDILAIIKKASQKEVKDRYQTVKELSRDIQRYQKNIRVSVRDYHPLEILKKWLQRNKQKVIASAFMLGVAVSLVCYFLWERKQEKANQFKVAIQEASLDQGLAEKVVLAGKNEKGQKVQHLLNTLNHLNAALMIRRADLKTEQNKLAVGNELILLCCEIENYQLAHYVANEIQQLSFLEQETKDNLKQFVLEAQSKTLTEHLARLDYWCEHLKNPEAGMRETALLEISKMPEEEIFQKLVKILKEGVLYYLADKERTNKIDEYYQMMVTGLGWIGNPKARDPLVEALDKISNKVATFPRNNRPVAERFFMVSIAEALVKSKAKKISTPLEQVYMKIGEDDIYWAKVKPLFEKSFLAESNSQTIDPKTDADYIRRGKIKEIEKDYQGAIEDFNESIRLNPNSKLAYLFRGDAKFQLGNYQGAVEDFTFILTFQSNDVSAFFRRAKAYLQLEQKDKALLDLNKVLQLDPEHISAYHARGIVKQEKGDLEGASADFKLSLHYDPQFLLAYLNLAYIKETQKDFSAALSHYNQILKINSKHLDALIRRARLKKNLNDYSGSLADYTSLIQFDPHSYQAYFERGRIKQFQGDLKGAILDYDEAIRIRPEASEEAYTNRGIMKFHLKHYSEALEDFNQALKLNPKLPQAYANRAAVKMRNKDFAGALKDLEKSLSIDSKAAETYGLRAEIRKIQKDYDGSLEDYNKAIELKPDIGDYYIQRGQIRIMVKNDKFGGLQDYSKGIELIPNDPLLYRERGNIYNMVFKDRKKAIENYSQSLSLKPDEPEVLIERGKCYHYLSQYKEAILDYQEGLRFAPKNPVLWYYQGESFLRLEETEKAIESFQNSLNFEPSNLKLAKKCANLLLQQTGKAFRKKQYKKAKEYLERFQKYAPKDHPQLKKIGQMVKRIEAMQKAEK